MTPEERWRAWLLAQRIWASWARRGNFGTPESFFSKSAWLVEHRLDPGAAWSFLEGYLW